MTAIAIYVSEGAEGLDRAGPWEVLATWAQEFDDNVEVFTIGDTKGPVVCAKGLRILTQYTRNDAPAYSVLLYPGAGA